MHINAFPSTQVLHFQSLHCIVYYILSFYSFSSSIKTSQTQHFVKDLSQGLGNTTNQTNDLQILKIAELNSSKIKNFQQRPNKIFKEPSRTKLKNLG